MGLVQRGVRLSDVVQAASREAASICSHALGSCPEVRMVVEHSSNGLGAAVPEYVYYVVLELLKNAMRATMMMHSTGCDGGQVIARAAPAAPTATSGVWERTRGDRSDDEPPVRLSVGATVTEGGEGRAGAGEEDTNSGRDGRSSGGRDAGQSGGVGSDVGGIDGGDIVFADVPEVSVSVRAGGEDDVLLMVSDRGGGIAEENVDKVLYDGVKMKQICRLRMVQEI